MLAASEHRFVGILCDRCVSTDAGREWLARAKHQPAQAASDGTATELAETR